MALETPHPRLRVCHLAEVRQAPSPDSPKLYVANPGKTVEPLSVAIVSYGRRCVPLKPRGWIDADALEPLGHASGDAANANHDQDQQADERETFPTAKADSCQEPSFFSPKTRFGKAVEDAEAHSILDDGRTSTAASGGTSAGTPASAVSNHPQLSTEVAAATTFDVRARLSEEVAQHLAVDTNLSATEAAACRVHRTISDMVRKLDAQGDVAMFGSFSTGLRTGGSDIDITFRGSLDSKEGIALLSSFADMLPHYGFKDVVKIFQSTTPLLKFTDIESDIQIDFCISNELGVRNSLLLNAYCEYDERAPLLGRLVKDWAKRLELVGTADGCLNSYAFVLLTVHYLQSLNLPVLLNLQELASESVPVVDSKWGCQDRWETKFIEDVRALPTSQNTQGISDLLTGFFHYFCTEFDWRKHAVCIRLNRPGVAIDKYSLATPTNAEQWYVEDPFDLKHNLGSNCTPGGRKRIIEAMQRTLDILLTSGRWRQACADVAHTSYYLKCRVARAVSPESLIAEFADVDLVRLYFHGSDHLGRAGQAFFEFPSSSSRRRAHTKNERSVAGCRLLLHLCSRHGLEEALAHGNYSTHEVGARVTNRSGSGIP